MSNHEEHPHESPKKVYFGIPFGFALTLWLIVFLCLKACDGPKSSCCKDGSECSKECMAKCEAEGKTECASQKECAKGGMKEEKNEEKKEMVKEEVKEEAAAESKNTEEKKATEEKH